MILFTISLLFILAPCDGDGRLDLKNCKYKYNACIGIKADKINQFVSMNDSEGCLRTSTCDVILRGTVESKKKINWILRIALKYLDADKVHNIYTHVRFGVESDPSQPIRVEFNVARTRSTSPTQEAKVATEYEPYGESLVVKSGVNYKAHTNQSVYFMKSYWPESITNETPYFYIYFWSHPIISYNLDGQKMSCETNLIEDDYYVYLYHSRYVPYLFTIGNFEQKITSERVNLFKGGPTKPGSTMKGNGESDSNTTLLVVLLVVIIVFTVALVILLVTCWFNRGKGPVSMETQQKLGGKTFQSSDTTTTTKDSTVKKGIGGYGHGRV